MVLAEAVKFDTGEVVLILLVALGSLVVTAAVVGGIGVYAGLGIARLRQSKAEVEALERGSLLGLLVVAGLLSIGGSMAPWYLLPARGGRWWPWMSLGLSLVAPAAWGWWSGRVRRYSGPASVPPPWPDPPPVDPPVPPADPAP